MKTAQIDLLNIGLMIIACAAAFIFPFELFLFSYAVLGPLHYLTEINWLHKRNYFVKGKYDYLAFILITILLLIGSYWDPAGQFFADKFDKNWYALFSYVAFGAALAMLFIKNTGLKILMIMVSIVIALAMQFTTFGYFVIIFAILLPTIIHVFLFTGLFMTYGALKSRSKTGLLSIGVFILCALSFFFFVPSGGLWNESYVLDAYGSFDSLNYHLGQLFQLGTFGAIDSQAAYREVVYYSNPGLMILRFIAFAYTYHYLNWFSKTIIIKWHKVNRMTLLITLGIWLLSVGIYSYDYATGLMVLFFLSVLHVLMEFPLNYRSFIGIGQEVRSISKSGFNAKASGDNTSAASRADRRRVARSSS